MDGETSAAARVFGIPELLELILLELPPRDALLAQRVSKEVRDTIRGSEKLQRRLFLRLANTSKTSGLGRDGTNILALNILGITTTKPVDNDQATFIGHYSQGRLRLQDDSTEALQDLLATNTASWREIYVKSHSQRITISMINRSETNDKTRKCWSRAQVAFQNLTIRMALQAGIGLRGVAEEYEEDIRYWIEREDFTGPKPKPKWRKWFGDDAGELMLGS